MQIVDVLFVSKYQNDNFCLCRYDTLGIDDGRASCFGFYSPSVPIGEIFPTDDNYPNSYKSIELDFVFTSHQDHSMFDYCMENNNNFNFLRFY